MKAITSDIPVYCINLIHRKDRKQNSMENFEKLGIKNVIFPVLEKHPDGGAYGCYDSHIKIWKEFYKTGTPYCLIFEDDFKCSKDVKENRKIIKKAIKFAGENLKKVDIILLHNFCIETDNKINNDYFTNGYGFSTHAMIITKNYIKSVIKKNGGFPQANGGHIDCEINVNSDNILYSEKIFFTKNECFVQIQDECDNYLNSIDKYLINDRTFNLEMHKKILVFIKNKTLMSDDNFKKILLSYYKLGTNMI
jgi:GR25 family glycosyltransferase involved in LPS biosynthesis